MNINIKATGMELTNAIRDYVESKLGSVEKMLHDGEGAYMHVNVGRDSEHHHKGEVYKAEVDLRAGAQSTHAEVTDADLYAAIDSLKDEVLEKLKAHKEKQENHRRDGGREIKEEMRQE